jgi:hypothetical protein
MRCEPVLREDFWPGADLWGSILELGSQEPRVFSHRKDAVIPLGTHDPLVPALLQELAPPALPAHRLFPQGGLLIRPPLRRGQGEQAQG